MLFPCEKLDIGRFDRSRVDEQVARRRATANHPKVERPHWSSDSSAARRFLVHWTVRSADASCAAGASMEVGRRKVQGGPPSDVGSFDVLGRLTAIPNDDRGAGGGMDSEECRDEKKARQSGGSALPGRVIEKGSDQRVTLTPPQKSVAPRLLNSSSWAARARSS
jgi:hypothetical protein